MFLRFLTAFALFLSVSPSPANAPSAFSPDFNREPVVLPANTPVIPLCSSPLDPLCMSQWSHQAVPLAVYQADMALPRFQYYLPSFVVSSKRSNKKRIDDDWEYMDLTPDYYRRKRRLERDSGTIELEKDEEESLKQSQGQDQSLKSQEPEADSRTSKERSGADPAKSKGEVSLHSGSKKKKETVGRELPPEEKPADEDTKSRKGTEPAERDERASTRIELPSGERIESPEETGDSTPEVRQTFYRHKSDPNRILMVREDESGGREVQEGQIVFVSEEALISEDEENAQPTQNPTSPPAKKEETAPAKKSQTKAEPAEKKDVKTGKPESQNQVEEAVPTQNVKTKKETVAVPATTGPAKPGCMELSEETQTEAGFCFDCRLDETEDPVLSTLLKEEGFMDALTKRLAQVAKTTKKRISGKVGQFEDLTDKICSPEQSVRAIIKNFKKSCPSPYKNNFKEFLEKAHCDSQEKGIPTEIMMAMMSIESAGQCRAQNVSEDERSLGLFQINSHVHGCVDQNGRSHKPRSSGSKQCLKDPVNNLNKAVDILLDSYKAVNPAPPAENKQWWKMSAAEKDAWRRAVSAYNSGSDWVNRAIQSARELETLTDTAYLTRRRGRSKYKKDTASWKQLRLYYFIEKLSPTNRRRTGRAMKNTISNLAHTEAVLGRNVRGASANGGHLGAIHKRAKPSMPMNVAERPGRNSVKRLDFLFSVIILGRKVLQDGEALQPK